MSALGLKRKSHFSSCGWLIPPAVRFVLVVVVFCSRPPCFPFACGLRLPMPADLADVSVCRGRRDLFATASDGGWWVTPPSVVGQQCSFKARYCQHGRSDDRARGRRPAGAAPAGARECYRREFRAKAGKNGIIHTNFPCTSSFRGGDDGIKERRRRRW